MLPALNGLLHRFSPASLLARYNRTYAPELYHLQGVCARGVFFVPIFHKIKQIPGDDNMKKEEDTVKTAALYIRVSTDNFLLHLYAELFPVWKHFRTNHLDFHTVKKGAYGYKYWKYFNISK